MITPEEFETAKRLAQEAIGNDPFIMGMAEINCRDSSLRDYMKPQRVLAMVDTMEFLIQSRSAHMEIHQGTIDTKEKLEKELQAAKAEIELLKSDASIKHKYRADALESELERTRGLLEEAVETLMAVKKSIEGGECRGDEDCDHCHILYHEIDPGIAKIRAERGEK